MKIFIHNGKYGVVTEENKVIVQPIYSSTFEMVKNDDFFILGKDSNKKAESQDLGMEKA